LNPQKNPAKNPATLEETRKDGQRSRFLLKEIWPQGCEKPDASNVRFESPFASHSPVAKSPFGAIVPFLHFFSQPSVLRGSLPGCLLGRTPQGLTPQKTPQNQASWAYSLVDLGYDYHKTGNNDYEWYNTVHL